MKYEKYISLIQSLEASAARSPGFYQYKVLLLTALGYAYFLGLILLAILPIVATIGLLMLAPEQIGKLLLYTAKLWWALIPAIGLYFGFIGSAIKSITAKVPEPIGKEIRRSDAPELFQFVENTCSKLRARKPSRVLVTDAFNAAIVTMPRFGIFGQKVLLLVGLPLMKAVSPQHLEAVLAHEIGHISGKHGAFAKWAYQMGEAWGRLIDSQAEHDHKFAALYKNFVDWFFPYFRAYSFVLMREHEKDADREAAQLTSVASLGEALILIDAKSRSLDEEFWKQVHDENLVNDAPSEKIFTRMLGALSFVDTAYLKKSLSKSLEIKTDFDDTHPSLADRLRLIGYWVDGSLPKTPGSFDVDAAERFLGDKTKDIAFDFDQTWQEQAELTWRDRYDQFKELQARLDELETKRTSGEASLDDLREMARLLTAKSGLESAIPVIEEAAERFPDDAAVWYNLGLAKLSKDDDSGLECLSRSAELDKNFKFEADQLAFSYLRGKGRLDEATKYANSMEEQTEIYQKAEKERMAAYPGDEFTVHDLPQEFIDAIPGKIAGLDEINSIYAAHKIVKYLPEYPYRVLFIDLRKKGRFRNRHDADAGAILKIIVSRFDSGDIHYFAILNGNWAGTKYYLDRIPGAKVYQRPD